MKHVPVSFWARFNDEFAAAAPFRLGEVLDGSPQVVAQTWRDGHFSAMFDFPLAFAMNDVFCRGQPLSRVASVLSQDRRYPDPAQLVTLLDNHDLPRLASVCGHDQHQELDALTFLTAVRGIPSLTWGTEVGLDGEREPETRASMRFEPTPLTAELRRLLEQRRASPALRDGAETILAFDAQHLVLGRAHSDQLALVVVNRAEQPFRPSLPAPWPQGECAPNQVSVLLTPRTPNAYAELAQAVDLQWRWPRTSPVTFRHASGVAGQVVGSSPELGDWQSTRAPTLPVTLELPRGGVFEFKFRSADGTWANGDNHVVFVSDEPMTVTLP